MKKLIFFILFLFAIFEIYYYKDNIYEFIILNYIYKDEAFIPNEYNEYRLNNNYNFVQLTDSYTPKNKQDIFNIIYSGLNNGWDEFSYFCNSQYEDCLEDSRNITDSVIDISYVNNFVHPYNSFKSIKIIINNLGKVTIHINKLYTAEEIFETNKAVEDIYSKLITDQMTDREKITAIHDYIINNTIYDTERAENISNNNIYNKYESQKAYGALLQGFAICGGYSDAMAIFLNKMGIKNYKISSSNHVWNLVNLDGKWYHLDLTWDDPVVNTKENLLLHNYFLITTDELENLDKEQHTFDKNVFVEAK